MLLVPTKLGASEIHGQGCFADRKIYKGEIVWSYDSDCDLSYDRRSVTVKQNLVSYCSPTGSLIVCGDNAQFINFAELPNLEFGPDCVETEYDLVAARDIEAGEELTVGRETDCDADRKLRLQPLIADAIKIISDAIQATVDDHEQCNPVIYFSGGKDSMVMLHLAISRGPILPVILHREPWQTRKYAFAESIIRNWELKAYDYPPLKVNLWQGKGIVAFTNFYQIGGNAEGPKFLALPKNIIESDSPSALCGRDDILSRPVGTFSYPWNLALVGHKSSDVDQIAGSVPLATTFVDNFDSQGPNICFPLANWSDDDVWDYIDQFAVPYQTDRYVNRREVENKSHNSDYFEACIRCVDRRNEEQEVYCPKLRAPVHNISHLVEYQDLRPSYILPEPEHATT